MAYPHLYVIFCQISKSQCYANELHLHRITKQKSQKRYTKLTSLRTTFLLTLIHTSSGMCNLKKPNAKIDKKSYVILCEDKGRDITQSYDKSPNNHRNHKKAKWLNKTKNATKTSITQRLWTDLIQSVRVTTATQLVWLSRFAGFQSSDLPQKLCNEEDTNWLEIIMKDI